MEVRIGVVLLELKVGWFVPVGSVVLCLNCAHYQFHQISIDLEKFQLTWEVNFVH